MIVAEIEPADVYQRVGNLQAMIEWMFWSGGVIALVVVVMLVLSFAADVYFIRQKMDINSKLQAGLERQAKADERLELWLSLLEMHQDRGAQQRKQTAEDVKFVTAFLKEAAEKGMPPDQAMAELKKAIAAVPKQVVTELKKEDSNLRALGSGDSHHGVSPPS